MFKSLFRSLKSSRPIEVFVRHCNYSSVSAHKARFPNFSREKCLENLLETMGEDVNITFFLDTFHPMEQEHFLKRRLQNSRTLQNRPFEPFCPPAASSTSSSMPSAAGHGPHPRPWQTGSKSSIFQGAGVLQPPLDKQTRFPIHQFKAGSEAASFLHMLEYVYSQKFSPDTIIYFLEDDYIHRPNWPTVLREAFTLPGVDYVTLYDHKDKYFFPQYAELKSKIFHTESCHWRTTPSTTNTYAMLFKTLKKHIDIHRCFSLGRTITADHDKFIKLSEEGAVLISSIPGFSTHAEPDYASPCADWLKILVK